MELKGKVAIVTGAGGAGVGGLGVDYARALAREGAAVLVSDINGDAAKQVARQLVEQGHRAIGVAADVADEAAVKSMVEACVREFGGVDILINNAGLCRDRWNLGLDLSTEDWTRILMVNTLAPLICARACRASMKARGGGVIVNAASSAAYGEYGAYSVTKAALVAMTNVLSSELGPDNIRVNAIAPGVMHGRIPDDVLKQVLDQQKLKRRGNPDDLLGALIYLCSERSSFVTGLTLRVDGGSVRGHI